MRTVDAIYGTPCPGSNATDIGSMAALRIGVFTDPSTPVGADTVAGLNDDDEIVVMADDLGGRAPTARAAPAGTTGNGQKIRIQRAGTPAQFGNAYVFQSTTLSPGPGTTPITNGFVLTNGGTCNNCCVCSKSQPRPAQFERSSSRASWACVRQHGWPQRLVYLVGDFIFRVPAES